MSLLLSFNKMKQIANDHQLDLISRQILLRKNCKITKDNAEIKIPKEKIKNEFGISLNPKFVKERNGLTIILSNVGDLYDLSPEEFENLVEEFATIDLNSSSFSAMKDLSEDLDEDEESLLNDFESRNTRVENVEENVEDEIKEDRDHEEDLQNLKKLNVNKKDVIDFVKKEITDQQICLIDEIKEEFGEKGVKIAIAFFSKLDDYNYDEEDETISKFE